MRILTVAGIVLLASGPLFVGWIYEVNPSDFSSNIAGPIFDEIVLGFVGLGVVSLALSRVPIKPRYATVIATIFILLPLAIFVAGNVQTSCLGCGGTMATAQVAVTGVSCSLSAKTCTITLMNSGDAVTSPSGSGIIKFGVTNSSLTTTTTGGIPAPGYEVVTYTFSGSPVSGQEYTGYVALSNGGQVPFAGTFPQGERTLVVATANSCSASGKTCTLTLKNTGYNDTNPTGSGLITIGGINSTLTTTTTGIIPAGGSEKVTCVFTGSPSAGQQYTGYVWLGDGEVVRFAGMFAS